MGNFVQTQYIAGDKYAVSEKQKKKKDLNVF